MTKEIRNLMLPVGVQGKVTRIYSDLVEYVDSGLLMVDNKTGIYVAPGTLTVC